MKDERPWPREPNYPATFNWPTAQVLGWTEAQYERWHAATFTADGALRPKEPT